MKKSVGRFFTFFGDIFWEMKNSVSGQVMKFSPKLVTIFSDEFSVDFSPFLVIFFGK